MIETAIFAMKKAMEIQSQGILGVLQGSAPTQSLQTSSQVPQQPSPEVAAEVVATTNMGGNLDITA